MSSAVEEVATDEGSTGAFEEMRDCGKADYNLNRESVWRSSSRLAHP